MLTKERTAAIARKGGSRPHGPVAVEGKSRSSRSVTSNGGRATALLLILPPHSARSGNEARQGFCRVLDPLIARYRPADEIEMHIVREMADYQWTIMHNKQLETAIFNRERIHAAAHEGLIGNRTLLELRKDTQNCHRTVALLERRLRDLQKYWAAAAPGLMRA
jgi:hypothetical protein